MSFLISMMIAFFGCLIGVPIALGVLKTLGVWTTVEERRSKVYVLFGEVIGILNEPGIHFLWPKLGWKAILVNCWARRTRSTCGSTRNTCAARRSTRKRGLRWG